MKCKDDLLIDNTSEDRFEIKIEGALGVSLDPFTPKISLVTSYCAVKFYDASLENFILDQTLIP